MKMLRIDDTIRGGCSATLKSLMVLAMLLCIARAPAAEQGAFDLRGPTLEVEITRGGVTLPIAKVANLAAGDRIWMKAALTPAQSAQYVLVAAFLRGATDPPPATWFTRCDTWTGACAKDGMKFTVPDGAQQLLVFLAPRTGGDFKTLMSAVRGRPGVFVRTSQNLNQAALEQQRLQTYLSEVRRLDDSDASRLKEAAPLLARTLAIRVNEQCLHKIASLQAACLMEGHETLILSDGHGETVTQQLTTGPASNLAMEASNTPQMRSGYYGPLIGSLMDIARLLDVFRTAKYQYIPALATPHGRELALTLNAPPSFHDPKSVLVAALPAVEPSQPPQLRAVATNETYCAGKEPLLLPVEGAPAAFAGSYAHDLMLNVTGANGRKVDLPTTPAPAQGGFLIDTSALKGIDLGGSARGVLRGAWGFDAYTGPLFTLVEPHGDGWALPPGAGDALVIGRETEVHLVGGTARCVSAVALTLPDGRQLDAEWKANNAGELAVKVPLRDAAPGRIGVEVRHYGAPAQTLTMHGFTEPGRLDAFVLHAGDERGVLRGTRVDEIASLNLNGVEFTAGTLSSRNGADELTMVGQSAADVTALRPGAAAKARVTRKDGRTTDVRAIIDEPRPTTTLLGKSVQMPATGSGHAIKLASPDELPVGARLMFSLRAVAPATFTRDEQVEIAAADDTVLTTLDQTSGGMALQSSRVAVASLDTKTLGSSAFGPLRYRVSKSGVAGDWQPLATLVRLPQLDELKCDAGNDAPCQLLGSGLYLLDSVAANAQFRSPVTVPEGFTGLALSVPRPGDGRLFLRLRDDPRVINSAQWDLPAPEPEAAPNDPAAGGNSSSPIATSQGAHDGAAGSPGG